MADLGCGFSLPSGCGRERNDWSYIYLSSILLPLGLTESLGCLGALYQLQGTDTSVSRGSGVPVDSKVHRPSSSNGTVVAISEEVDKMVQLDKPRFAVLLASECLSHPKDGLPALSKPSVVPYDTTLEVIKYTSRAMNRHSY